jgi:hypothetical protein
VAGVITVALLLAACSSTGGSAAHRIPTTTTAVPGTTTTAGAPATAPASTASTAPAEADVTWLCRPGTADDPCLSDRRATAVLPSGRTVPVASVPASSPKIDCFYVYPTVSTQPTANSTLAVEPQETAVAVAQASRFSQVCDVYAPMYRQLTLAAIDGQAHVTGADRDLAYGDVLAAWNYYLSHFNHGRGVAFIGHSQGSAMLIELLRSQVDPDPTLRARMVSAILLGGNVTVPVGRTTGGTFADIPACTNVQRPGCVIAYSSFDKPPPTNSIFGRTSSPINALSDQSPAADLQVLCVNPVAGSGGATLTPTGKTGAPSSAGAQPTASGTIANLSPYFPTAQVADPVGTSQRKAKRHPTITTPWVTYPHLYRAQCQSSDGATWLQVDDIAGAKDGRPVVQQVLGPTWGLHLVDVNIALGNLVDDLRGQADHYRG